MDVDDDDELDKSRRCLRAPSSSASPSFTTPNCEPPLDDVGFECVLPRNEKLLKKELRAWDSGLPPVGAVSTMDEVELELESFERTREREFRLVSSLFFERRRLGNLGK